MMLRACMLALVASLATLAAAADRTLVICDANTQQTHSKFFADLAGTSSACAWIVRDPG